MSEKTEEPTDKKLDDARKKGQGPKSQDVVAGVVLITSLIALAGAGPAMFDRMSQAVGLALSSGLQAETVEQALAIAVEMLFDGLYASLPLVLAAALMAAVALFAQLGPIFSTEAITPKFEKINPGEGIKKLISVRSLVEVAKAIVKAVALGAVIWMVIRNLLPTVVGSAYLSPSASSWIAWQSVLQLLGATCIVFLVVGPVDFGLQRWLFVRDNKMSKDDIKREHKDAEGDPHMKGHRRALAEEMATTPPPPRVPGATVVVTNPTHYAVALYYVAGKTPLPIVVAKGMDEQAAEIRALATAHGVPIVSNPPLARALHRLGMHETVPEELLEAVAVVLRWVAEIGSLGSKPQ